MPQVSHGKSHLKGELVTPRISCPSQPCPGHGVHRCPQISRWRASRGQPRALHLLRPSSPPADHLHSKESPLPPQHLPRAQVRVLGPLLERTWPPRLSAAFANNLFYCAVLHSAHYPVDSPSVSLLIQLHPNRLRPSLIRCGWEYSTA